MNRKAIVEAMTADELRVFEDRAFNKWMAQVDAVVVRAVGLSVRDLPDIAFRDMFDDREDPAEAAAAALENAGYDADGLEDL